MPYPHRRSGNLLPYVVFFSLLQLCIHLLGNNHYGFHRDELLHLALGEHLDWGFKEVPPVIAALAWLITHTLGDSLFAVRLLPALCSAIIVFVGCLASVEMGGRRFAVIITGTALTFAPSFLASGYLFQPVVFDQLWWVLSAWFMAKFIRTHKPVYLYLWAAVTGFGMLTKYTMAFYTLSLLVGLLISGHKKVFANKHFWLACGLGLLIFSPNLIWQVSHQFPVLRHMKELRETQLEYISPLSFLMEQLLSAGTGMFVFVPGLIFLLFTIRLKNFRFIGIALIFTLLLLILGSGKVYYAFGAYPLVFSAGGYACERMIKSSLYPLRWVLVIFLLLPNLLFLPLAVPLLPIKKAVRVFAWMDKSLGLHFPFKWEDRQQHPLTQDYADMYGWDELARKVAGVYNSLPQKTKKSTIIFADDYGQAGAIDHFGKMYGLPKAVCLSSSFAIWAPEKLNAENMIYINDELDFRHQVSSAKKVAEIRSVYAREKGMPIYWIEGLKQPIKDVYHQQWLKLR